MKQLSTTKKLLENTNECGEAAKQRNKLVF